MSILIGCVADDLTGASDVALMLATAGMNVSLITSMPKSLSDITSDAVVVALKTRTCPVSQAVQQSLAVVRQMQTLGVQQVYFKYCSTFDSTSQGNIGPVAEALMDALDTSFSVVVPSFPENARTVYMGHLFVGTRLLSDSGMKDHPLTPMRDANLLRTLRPQLKQDTCVSLISFDVVKQGRAAIRKEFEKSSARSLAVVDTLTNEDLMEIGAACKGMSLVTGGSGLAMGLPQNFVATGELKEGHGSVALPQLPGPMVVLAGSCSQATRAQIKEAEKSMPTVHLDAAELLTGSIDVARLLEQVQPLLSGKALLIYSSADPATVAQIQAKYGRSKAGGEVEKTLGALAQALIKQGVQKFVIAGGETSGAVADAIGLNVLKVGPEIAPGVPWTVSEEPKQLLITFKSGNFGDEDFFNKALRMVP